MLPSQSLADCSPNNLPQDGVDGAAVRPAPAGMELDIRITSDINVVANEWARLLQDGLGTPYQGPEWCRAYLEAFGQERSGELCLVHARSAGALVLILPLSLERRASLKTLRFFGADIGNQNTAVWDKAFYDHVTQDDIRKLTAEVCRMAGADCLILENVPAEWHGRHHPLILSGAQPSPSPVFRRPLPNDFPALFAETHSKSARKNLTRKQRHLQDAGDYRSSLCTSPEDISAGLEAFLEQREARAKITGIPNAFSSRPAQAFLRKAAGLGSCGGSAPLSLWTLTAGGHIRATYLCARLGGTLYAYSNSVAHDDMLKNSPGLVLIRDIIEGACKDPVLTVLDLGLGEERYKSDWTSAQELCDSYLAVSIKGRIAGAILRSGQRLKSAIRNSTTLWPLVRKIRRLRAPGG